MTLIGRASCVLERFAKSSGSVNCRVIAGQEPGNSGEKPSTFSRGAGRGRGRRGVVEAFSDRALSSRQYLHPVIGRIPLRRHGQGTYTASLSRKRQTDRQREKEREREKRSEEKGQTEVEKRWKRRPSLVRAENTTSPKHMYEDSTFREALHHRRPRIRKRERERVFATV